VAQNIVAARDPGIKSVYYLSTAGNREQYARAVGTFVSPGVEAANQYLLDTLMNGHEPNVVVFCRTDATMSSSASHWRADHGGATWQSQHIPLILAGPGIRKGLITAQPAQLEDVAPTILADMGAPHTGMEGHVLADALESAGDAQRQARAREAKRLQPLVAALNAQDVYERTH
jgi:hypothetical protein